MSLTTENILLIGSLLLFISIIVGKTSYRFGIPTLILFLAIGMLAGSEGILGIYFDDPKLAQFIGIVSLNFILFSGGLDTSWSSIKPVLWQGISLSTFGVLFTAVSLGLFVWAITDFTLFEGLLLGAIVSSTDAAAVFSILRSKRMGLKHNLRPTLELESGSNDPMAYVLTIAFLSLITHPERSTLSIIPLFLLQMSVGAFAGFAMGWLSKFIINHIRIVFEGLYPVMVIAFMFFTFSLTDFLGGNGFLAVYLCAVYLGNHELIHKKTIIKMYDGLSWLMQIILFLTLGLLVFPSRVFPLIGIGLLISLFLILVARPLSVHLSLLPFRMNFPRRIFISWVGLRGAVPIVFATYPLLAGIGKADMIFNIVFFVSVTSVLIQGTTFSVLARWLKLSLPEDEKPVDPVELLLNDFERSRMSEIIIPENSYAVGKKIIELKFPEFSIIAMIKRGDKYLTPSGSTVLQASDVLIVLSDTGEGVNCVYKALQLGLPENVPAVSDANNSICEQSDN